MDEELSQGHTCEMELGLDPELRAVDKQGVVSGSSQLCPGVGFSAGAVGQALKDVKGVFRVGVGGRGCAAAWMAGARPWGQRGSWKGFEVLSAPVFLDGPAG